MPPLAMRIGSIPTGDQATSAMVRPGDEFTPDAKAAGACIGRSTRCMRSWTTFTDPLFRSMFDSLQGLERAGDIKVTQANC